MARKIQIARALAARWATVNPILWSGEFGYETDTGKTKIGNGVDDWNTLGYEAGGSGVSQAYVDDADETLQTNINNEATTRATADANLQSNINNLTTDQIAQTSDRVFLSPAELTFLQQLKADYQS